MRAHTSCETCQTCTCTHEPVPPLETWEKLLLTVAVATVIGAWLLVLWVIYGVVTMGGR